MVVFLLYFCRKHFTMSKEMRYCTVCGEPMLKRPQAIYCSVACQQKAKRTREENRVENIVSIAETVPVLQEEIKGVKGMFLSLMEILALRTTASNYLEQHPNIKVGSVEWKEYVTLRDKSEPLNLAFWEKYKHDIRRLYGKDNICSELLDDTYNYIKGHDGINE